LLPGGWTPFAVWDGSISVTAAYYNNGYGVRGGDNWSDECSKYNAFKGDGGALVVCMKMGVVSNVFVVMRRHFVIAS
jgi:hypothetical protein